jgi:hypothetical protein
MCDSVLFGMFDLVLFCMFDSVLFGIFDSVLFCMFDSVLFVMFDSVLFSMFDSVLFVMFDSVLFSLFDSVLFGMYADDSYSYVQKEEMDKLVLDSEGQVSNALSDLFLEVNLYLDGLPTLQIVILFHIYTIDHALILCYFPHLCKIIVSIYLSLYYITKLVYAII